VNVVLLVMTDGRRDCITEAIPSTLAHLKDPIDRMVIHDDSGDPDYRVWLAETFPQFEVIGTSTRQGFAGAYANAWRHLATLPHRWVFSTEDDFTFNRDVQLGDMAHVLKSNPHVAQIALRRQPWNEQEHAAGGVVEQHPGDYEDAYLWAEYSDYETSYFDVRPHPVLLHRRFFTTNPSMFRTELCRSGWPDVPNSEGIFTHQLLASDPDLRFAFWGARADPPWVEHIGRQRVGTGY
jgi:Glycosyl transferase family 2